MTQYKTPLGNHLKEKSFWIDIIILAGLWIIFLYTPRMDLIIPTKYWVSISRILSLVASLELLSFFSYHLIGKKHGLLISGFFGGLVSSTVTFARFTSDKELIHHYPQQMIQALLLALVAMLFEAALIIYSISSNNIFSVLAIILAQAFVYILAVLFFQSNKEHQLTRHKHEVTIDKPIIWKRVLTLTGIILLIILATRGLADFFEYSFEVSSFIIALIEAHGVIAAACSEFDQPEKLNVLKRIVLIVLASNTLSKSMLVIKTKNKKIIVPMLLTLMISFLTSLIAFVFVS